MRIMSPIIDVETEEIIIPKTMSFLDAMGEILEGKKVFRVSWGNGDYCLMREGWLSIFTKGEFHTWSVNDGDTEGEDWSISIPNND